MDRDTPERVYWSLCLFGSNPLLFTEDKGGIKIVKDGLNNKKDIEMVEMAEHFQTEFQNGFKKIGYVKLCYCKLIEEKRTKKIAPTKEFSTITFSPNFPNFQKDLDVATAVEISVSTITMLSPTIGVISRHLFKEKEGYYLSYIKASFSSQVHSGVKTLDNFRDVRILNPDFQHDSLNEEFAQDDLWYPLNDFVWIAFNEVVTDSYFLPALNLTPTTSCLAAYGYPSCEITPAKNFVEGFPSKWGNVHAGQVEKELVTKYKKLERVPEDELGPVAEERANALKTYFELEHKAVSLGPLYTFDNSIPFIRARLSCFSGMSGGPLTCADNSNYLLGIMSGSYKRHPENYFIPVSNIAFIAGYKEYVYPTLKNTSDEVSEHLQKYIDQIK